MNLKKILFAVLGLGLLLQQPAKADEGMWLPMFLNQKFAEMQAMGLQLTPDQIYSLNHSSLKDAIVSLGGFCTAEVVSQQGLLLTNHHCGYDQIRSHSTPEMDYLKDGFWAMNKEEELSNPGLFVRFLVRMEDVTEDVLADVTDDMSEEDRNKIIAEKSDALQAKAMDGTGYDASVKAFYEGNNYYMFVYETYKDIRLVAAPPESVGKYGGDTDNWMWPRHTGDFSMFRVYASPDNKPAEYAEENVPLKPRHSLPISMDGVQNGDFTMTFGYPGSTDRFMTSWGIDELVNISYPARIDLRAAQLEIMKKYMDSDPAMRLKFASDYASTANYWKNFIGKIKGVNQLNVIEKKRAMEAELAKWINADPAKKSKYGSALQLIEESYAASNKTAKSRAYVIEAGLATDAVVYAFRMNRVLGEALEGDDDEALAKAVEKAKAMTAAHFDGYYPQVDKEMFATMMRMYYKNISKDQLPEIFKLVDSKYKGSIDAFITAATTKSIMFDKAKMEKFLAKPKAKVWKNDLIMQAADCFVGLYFAGGDKDVKAKRARGNRLFVAALKEMQPNKAFYPDANSTLRLSYGKVGDYQPRDAVHYNYYTTMDGLMEKMDNSDPEFVVPDRLVELYKAKDYGKYVDAKGHMPVCFIHSNDITGGNSGSPVINGRGELIGLAFDGNWEAMSGDIAFEPEIQRTISVDIRYVLFMIEKYGKAHHLIREMKLVKQPAVVQEKEAAMAE